MHAAMVAGEHVWPQAQARAGRGQAKLMWGVVAGRRQVEPVVVNPPPANKPFFCDFHVDSVKEAFILLPADCKKDNRHTHSVHHRTSG